MALILRRNEAERKKHNAKSTILYSNSACTLPKGLPTSQSQTQKHLILYSFSFLSFCIFFLFFPRLRTSCFYRFGPKASNSCTLFLVRTCLKLPSPGHAKHCRRHHFWTGLARLFRTIKRNIDIFCVFESFGFFSFLNVGEQLKKLTLRFPPGVMQIVRENNNNIFMSNQFKLLQICF